jgi:hypothetical protein
LLEDLELKHATRRAEPELCKAMAERTKDMGMAWAAT